jgi:hypothetical protein
MTARVLINDLFRSLQPLVKRDRTRRSSMQMAYRQVVRIDAAGRVVDRVVSVRKSRDEDVLWVAQSNGGPWKITFDKDASGSPFSETSYDVQRGGSGGSTGGPVGGVVGRTYRYNVRDAAGTITDDPDIDIET